MKLFHFEFKKLLGIKQALIFTLLLLALNCALCTWTIRSEDAALDEMNVRMNTDLRRGLIEADRAYQASSEEVATYYASLQSIWDDYWEICERLPESSWPAEPEFAHTYSARYDDWRILHDYFDELEEDAEYSSQIQALIATAERTAENYIDFGGSESDYIYRYQQQCIDTYSKLTDRQLQKGYVYGWDRLFDYTAGDWLLFLASIYFGALLFTRERSDGMHLMLRATPHGRSRLALSKMAATLPLSGGLALLFTLVSFATVGALWGYSTPLAELQLIDSFRYSPFSLNMAGYLLCLFLYRWLAAEVLLKSVCFCSVLFKRMIPAVAAGLLLCAASLYLSERAAENPICFLNFFSLASGANCCRRFYAIPIGSLSIPLLPLILGIAALLLVAMILLTVWCHSVQSSIVRTPKVIAAANALFARCFGKVRGEKKQSVRVRCSKRHSSRLLPYEAHKLLSPILLIAVAVLAGARIYGNLNAYPEQLSYYEASKEGYCRRWGGVMTDEKLAEAEALYDEYVTLVNDKERAEEMLKKFSRKEITYDEYSAYVQSYQNAEAQLVPLESVLSQMRYLVEQSKAHGVETVLFYDYDLRIFADRTLDLPLYCMILLLFASCFSAEASIHPILHTTRNGRSKLWRQKYVYAALWSLALSVSMGLSDILMWLANGREDSSILSVPLISCRLYEKADSNLSILEYLVLLFCFQVLGYLLLSWTAVSLSGILGHSGATLLALPLLTLTPYLLSMLGSEYLSRFDYTALLSGDRLWRSSFQDGNIAYLVIFVCVSVCICALLSVGSYRKQVK